MGPLQLKLWRSELESKYATLNVHHSLPWTLFLGIKPPIKLRHIQWELRWAQASKHLMACGWNRICLGSSCIPWAWPVFLMPPAPLFSLTTKLTSSLGAMPWDRTISLCFSNPTFNSYIYINTRHTRWCQYKSNEFIANASYVWFFFRNGIVKYAFLWDASCIIKRARITPTPNFTLCQIGMS